MHNICGGSSWYSGKIEISMVQCGQNVSHKSSHSNCRLNKFIASRQTRDKSEHTHTPQSIVYHHHSKLFMNEICIVWKSESFSSSYSQTLCKFRNIFSLSGFCLMLIRKKNKRQSLQRFALYFAVRTELKLKLIGIMIAMQPKQS